MARVGVGTSVILVGLFVVGGAAVHGGSKSTTDEERNRIWDAHFADHLPAYCKYTQSLPDFGERHAAGVKGDYGHPLSTGKYARMFGGTWHYLHHYCMGLEAMYRAISAAPNKKAYWYQCAKNEFNFVLARVQKPFVLHAELLFNMGISTLSAGQETEGVQYLTMALEIDPTFVPAYAALSDFFEVRGDSAQAAAIAETGLSHAPNSDVLRDKLLALQARAGDPTSGDDGP